MNNKKLLPLGSIIYLQEGTQKLMIVGRGVIFDRRGDRRTSVC